MAKTEPSHLKRWTDKAWDMTRKHLPGDTDYYHSKNQPLRSAFWRTLIGDRLRSPLGSHRPAPDDYLARFEAAQWIRKHYHLIGRVVNCADRDPESLEYLLALEALQGITRSRLVCRLSQ